MTQGIDSSPARSGPSIGPGSPPPAHVAIDADDTPAAETPDAILLEVGWEVCNPVGGIYQVLRSKTATMTERWGRRYVLLGPWMPDASPLELEPLPAKGWMGRTLDAMRDLGYGVHHGRWLVTGRPRTVLLDPEAVPDLRRAEAAAELEAAVGRPTGGCEALVGQAIAFAAAAREFIQIARRELGEREIPRPLLCHFHEWLGGLAIPLLRQADPPPSAFTTHATILGRYLAGSEDGLDPTRLESLDADAEAQRMGISAQYGLERACAHGADVFTTVSAVTADECAVTLGRRPDVITPNGLNVGRFSAGPEVQTMHAVFKERIEEFVRGHFFPSYSFDLDRTHYMFTSGRYEPRNKGFDLCLEAMARLDAALRTVGTDLTVVFFIVSRRPTRSLDPEALQMRGVLHELREVCKRIGDDIGDKLFQLAATGERASLDALLEEYWDNRFERTRAAFRRDGHPPVTTHVLRSEGDDPVLSEIRRLGFRNGPEDRVKIVYSPDFITPTSPIWGLEYDQFVRGCHLGLFPSAYEPWGYTPQECIACGVPAISSDLAGFGRYAIEHPESPAPESGDTTGARHGWGPWILPRRDVGFHDAAADLARRMLEFCTLERRDRIALRHELVARSWDFDWSQLGNAYHDVHDRLLDRIGVESP